MFTDCPCGILPLMLIMMVTWSMTIKDTSSSNVIEAPSWVFKARDIFKLLPPLDSFLYFYVVLPSVHPSHVCAYVCDVSTISMMCVDGFCTKLLSVMHLGTEMNWSGFGVKMSKVKGQRHNMTIVSISRVCLFSLYLSCALGRLFPDFCQYCILGQRWTN